MKHRAWFLGIIFVSALFLRCYGLGRVGFSEDEANKILADGTIQGNRGRPTIASRRMAFRG